VFTPGARTGDIVEWVRANLPATHQPSPA
jgi:hypothetical protein